MARRVIVKVVLIDEAGNPWDTCKVQLVDGRLPMACIMREPGWGDLTYEDGVPATYDLHGLSHRTFEEDVGTVRVKSSGWLQRMTQRVTTVVAGIAGYIWPKHD